VRDTQSESRCDASPANFIFAEHGHLAKPAFAPSTPSQVAMGLRSYHRTRVRATRPIADLQIEFREKA
jgi:hypothetical protein